MYTDLPKVTAVAETFKTDINMMQSIKIKLLRGGVFSVNNLLTLPVGDNFIINSVDLNIGTTVHLIPKVVVEPLVARNCILMALLNFLVQNWNLIDQFISPIEKNYLLDHLDLFFSIEFFPGCYVVRI